VSTPATEKRPAARRVFAEKAVWLRCSSVEDPPGIFSFVASRHPAFSPKTAPLVVSKQALKANAVPSSDDGIRTAETQKLMNGTWQGGTAFKFLTVRNLQRTLWKCLGFNLGDSWNLPPD
jgi:hypothetical protein